MPPGVLVVPQAVVATNQEPVTVKASCEAVHARNASKPFEAGAEPAAHLVTDP